MQIIASLALLMFSAVAYAQVSGMPDDPALKDKHGFEVPATIETGADYHEESSVTIEEETPEQSARMTWSLGTGIEARIQREVNPDYSEATMLGQLFVQMNRGHWGGQLEVSREERNTSSGGFHIDTTSTNAGLWGRYSILLERPWHPYFTGGLGSYFDTVTSSYGSSSVEKSGQRKYWGLGVGVSRTFWRHLMVEAEGRGALVEDRKDPMFSGLIRIGVQI